MSYSVKDELDSLIKAGQSMGQAADKGILRTVIRARGLIETLEARLAGTLTARDQIALHMLPHATEYDDGETMGKAFMLADLFIEASKEVQS